MQGDVGAQADEPALVADHVWPEQRDAFETRAGATYCRRCCRMLAADRRPDFVQTSPCRRVPISFRAESIKVVLGGADQP
jgi:hypothetical protein